MGNDLGTRNGTGSEIKREDKEEGVCEEEGQSEVGGAAVRRAVRTFSCLQVRQRVSTSAVGRWRHYAAQLCRSMLPELQQHMPALAQTGALPCLDPDTAGVLMSSLFAHTALLPVGAGAAGAGAGAAGAGADSSGLAGTCAAPMN